MFGKKTGFSFGGKMILNKSFGANLPFCRTSLPGVSSLFADRDSAVVFLLSGKAS